MTKSEMIDFLTEEPSISGYNRAELSKMKYDEVKEVYDEYVAEVSDDSDMYPNGRDYDAEDEDWP